MGGDETLEPLSRQITSATATTGGRSCEEGMSPPSLLPPNPEGRVVYEAKELTRLRRRQQMAEPHIPGNSEVSDRD